MQLVDRDSFVEPEDRENNNQSRQLDEMFTCLDCAIEEGRADSKLHEIVLGEGKVSLPTASGFIADLHKQHVACPRCHWHMTMAAVLEPMLTEIFSSWEEGYRSPLRALLEEETKIPLEETMRNWGWQRSTDLE